MGLDKEKGRFVGLWVRTRRRLRGVVSGEWWVVSGEWQPSTCREGCASGLAGAGTGIVFGAVDGGPWIVDDGRWTVDDGAFGEVLPSFARNLLLRIGIEGRRRCDASSWPLYGLQPCRSVCPVQWRQVAQRRGMSEMPPVQGVNGRV